PSISDGRLSYQFSSDGYIRRSVYAYDIIQFLSHNTPHLLFPHLQILRKQTKTSVHDVQNVQNNLSGTGVRRAPGRLHFPECAGYEKPEIQSLL
ncbi:hypothetical protein RNN08_22125, partial [Escherichia coli]|nr:hypothetical protein [Escherichia coli]